ncbi:MULTISPECIES: hypothetical protein [Bacillaceae]|uniref:Uncharacterized protein n=1 Tax=Evansella alkalicola TaxID=745819 RepID=A0ABS6JTC2_9BACI|nr:MULTISPECIES: hypothetical protein [Bacillaceae]MBU9721492.1 hypothetical protein [Bacillus alkalicola]
MINRSMFTVKRKARRYKKWLEKITIYPYPYEVSGRNYYLIDYVKLNQTIGGAIMSDQEEHHQDVKKAHRNLYLFYRLHEKILEGKVRASVKLEFFRIPLKRMDETPDPKWKAPYKVINRLLDLQLLYRKTYDDFWEHISEIKEKKLPLKDEELELAINTAAKLETIQYHVVCELANNMDVLKQWKQLMQEKKMWDEMKKEQQVFYTQLMQNEEFMMEEAKKAKSDNFDKAFKLNKEAMTIYMSKEQKSDYEVLRYP